MVGRFGAVYPLSSNRCPSLPRKRLPIFGGPRAARPAQRGLHDPGPDALRQRALERHQGRARQLPVVLDRLLVNALIEARSCERFKLLSEGLDDPELRRFYRELMESEARHYRLFCGLSEELFGVKLARERLSQLAARESQLSSKLPLGPKVHG